MIYLFLHRRIYTCGDLQTGLLQDGDDDDYKDIYVRIVGAALTYTFGPPFSACQHSV